MTDILLSFLITYRTPERKSGHNYSTIFDLFENLSKTFVDKDREKIEIIIKIDNDDVQAISDCTQLHKYHFKTKVLQYGKWEGRWCFNYHQMYMFSYVDKKSRFICIITDDCLFYSEKGKNLIKELETHKDNNYVIFGGSPFKNEKELVQINPKERYDKKTDYKTVSKSWTTHYYIEGNSIVSKKIIECMGNMGWSVNIDITLGILPMLLYKKYNISIFNVLQNLVMERKDNYREDKNVPSTFNETFQIVEEKIKPDSYYYDLTEQQAKNIYLNMKEDGVI